MEITQGTFGEKLYEAYAAGVQSRQVAMDYSRTTDINERNRLMGILVDMNKMALEKYHSLGQITAFARGQGLL